MKKKLEINKENYKKYIEYLKLEKKQDEKLCNSAWLAFLTFLIAMPCFFLVLLTKIPAAIFSVALLDVISISGTLYKVHKENLKYKELCKKYLNGQDWNVDEIEEALEKAHILKYEPHTDLDFL